MEKKQVVKRGGNREDFSPAKIRKTIERAAAGFELDLQPLEEKMADFAKDGVSTAEIAKYLTLSALSLTTVTDPDWKNAAGRLKLFELYKQMSETRQTGKNYNNLYDYPQFLKFAEENGIYSKRISEVYSEEEIKLAAGTSALALAEFATARGRLSSTGTASRATQTSVPRCSHSS